MQDIHSADRIKAILRTRNSGLLQRAEVESLQPIWRLVAIPSLVENVVLQCCEKRL
jgi:hypothetical protein